MGVLILLSTKKLENIGYRDIYSPTKLFSVVSTPLFLENLIQFLRSYFAPEFPNFNINPFITKTIFASTIRLTTLSDIKCR